MPEQTRGPGIDEREQQSDCYDRSNRSIPLARLHQLNQFSKRALYLGNGIMQRLESRILLLLIV